jgi:hypothetical protein
MTTRRERRSAAFWRAVAPALILTSVLAALGLYALIDGLNRSNLVHIGLGLISLPLDTYLFVKILRVPDIGRPNGSSPHGESHH